MSDDNAKVDDLVAGRFVLELISGDRTSRVEVTIDGVTHERVYAIIHAVYREAMTPQVTLDHSEWVKS